MAWSSKVVFHLWLKTISQIFQFAGHCLRASSEIISKFLSWKPKLVAQHFQKLIFLEAFSRDTRLKICETAMRNRNKWLQRVQSFVPTAVATNDVDDDDKIHNNYK